MNKLLIGWKAIHEELFLDESGKQLISYETLCKRHGPGLKASGALLKWKTTKSRHLIMAGWSNIIQNYFIKLGQEEEAERQHVKALKKSQKAINDKTTKVATGTTRTRPL